MGFVRIVLIILLLGLSIFGQTSFENGMITFSYKQVPLHSFLSELKNKTGANFIYRDDLIRDYRVTGITVNSSVENAIKKVLSSSNLDYKKFSGDNYVIFKKNNPKKKPYGIIITTQTDIAEIDTTVVLTHPRLISKCDPIYPSEAIKNNLGGKVVLKLLINKDGKVIKTIVGKSSGYSVLDEAAIDYSRELKFSPALRKQKPIEIWLSMVFNYKLE